MGRYNHFEGGSIYWTPRTGPHEVHGAIRDLWASTGWENGFLGYSVSERDGPAGQPGEPFRPRPCDMDPGRGAVAHRSVAFD